MDLGSLTFIGLMTLGFVNVVSFYKPNLDSKIKFTLSLVFAFALTFVPVEFANVVLDKAKQAIEVALAASGTYKLAQKAGGI
jgi:uncharacterized membrane protein (DUF485 family)